MLDDETEAKIDELTDELYEAHVEDQTIRFWEGSIVQTVPTGPPPEYLTVEIEGINDQSVMWRGMPASLVVSDRVLVWENPITHRREIWGGSGANGTSTASPWQKITVAVSGGDFALLSAAITWINALAAPIAPSATRLFAINILGGTFVEAADVVIPQWVGVEGEGEETVLDMGDATLELSPDTSLENCVVTSTADDNWYVILLEQADNAVMRDVRVIVTGTGGQQVCVDTYRTDDFELYHVICESTQTTNWGFYLYKSTGLLWGCKVDDSTNFEEGLRLGTAGNPSTVTTKFCEFRAAAAGDDVNILATNVWSHFCCQFDPDNSTIAGTEVPLTHGKTNFDDIVYFENGFTMDGVSGANVVTIPTAQAIALQVVDANAVEYWRIDTAPQLISHFNQGEADIDTIFSASGATNALFVRGSDGWIGNTNAPVHPRHFIYTDATTARQFERVENTATNNSAALFAQVGITAELDITHSGTSHIQLYGMSATIRVRGAANSAHPSWRDVNCFRASGFNYNTATVGYIAGFGLDMRNLSTGTVTNLIGVHVPGAANTGGGVITNFYGLKIDPTATAGTNWGVHQSGAGMYNLFSGRLAVGGTPGALAQLHVDQSAAGGAIPVLLLDQADLSEQCIDFSSDGVDRDINLWTVDVTGTPTLMWDESQDAYYWDKSFRVIDDWWCGLAAGGGRIVFDNQAPDYISLMNCIVGINTLTPACGLDMGGVLPTWAAGMSAQTIASGGGGGGRFYLQGSVQADMVFDDTGGALNCKLVQHVSYDGTYRIRRLNDNATLKGTDIFIGSDGDIGMGGTLAPATLLELERTETLVGNVGDGYEACITLDPGYTGAFTVTRHNYVDCQNVSVAGGAAVTDAAILRLDAALGTHLATTNADKTANAKVGTLKINANGTIVHIQLYAT